MVLKVTQLLFIKIGNPVELHFITAYKNRKNGSGVYDDIKLK